MYQYWEYNFELPIVMTIFNISLPDSMQTFVEEQVKQKGYSTAIEYIHHLICQEQE